MIDIIDIYRLHMYSAVLAEHTARLHSLASINAKHKLSDKDLTMLKASTQGVLDYAQKILDKEQN